MKNVICTIFLAGAVLVMGCNQLPYHEKNASQCEAAEKAILETHAALVAAAENRDVEGMFNYILENDKGAMAICGELMTRQEAMEQVQQGVERVADIKYDFKQRNVKMLSPTIGLMTAVGATTSTIDTGQTFVSEFANTSIFVLQDEDWKILHGHHSIPVRN